MSADVRWLLAKAELMNWIYAYDAGKASSSQVADAVDRFAEAVLLGAPEGAR